MPALREIRQRIKGTKNMAKITQAMQMVASSKMRRVQERVERSRPYSEQLRDLVSRLANASGDDLENELALLKQRPVRNIGMILVTPDRGLCGALPSNINRYAALTAQQQQEKLVEQGRHPGISYVGVGRKGRDFIIRTQQNLIAEFINYGDRPSMNDASAIAQVAVDAFLKGEVDLVYLIYAKFINTVTQQPTAVQLLPVQPPAEQGESSTSTDYIYEPSPREIFQALLPRYVDVQVYQALLEAVASEQSAKMVAMKNATDNANELVQDLTLTYNKARQAAITTQILEVVAGAEAL
ncbi:MAG TPA: ATP synthase F1 subunit gamma [Ktedonobacteraceae bacterium]|nr:ATP synthase F1 subunit gamma [Ktedonobacteraceae bacterium]